MVKLKRGPGSYGKALSEILTAQREHAQRSLELEALRRRHRQPSSFLEGDRDGIAAAEKEAETIAKLEEQLAQRASELEELWAKAGALSDETGRLGGTDDEILSQVDALEQRRRHLVATCEGRFREDVHEQLDSSLAIHRAAFDAHASRPDWRFADRLVQSYTLGRDPEFAKTLHDAVDSRTDFAPGTRDGYRSERDRLARELERRRHELALRAEEASVQEAEQARVAAADRLAALEAQPVTVTT